MSLENVIELHPVNLKGRSSFNTRSFRFVDIKNIPINHRKELKVSKKSLFRDPRWDFTAEFPDSREEEVILDFSKIRFSDGTSIFDSSNDIYLEQIKEYYFTLMVDPPSSYPKLTTWVSTTKRGIKLIFDYMKNNSIFYLSELDRDDLQHFLEGIATEENQRGGALTNRTLLSRAQGLDWLYEQGKKMTAGLCVDPFAEFGSRTQWSKAMAQKVIERGNSGTVEIPDAVVEELVENCLDDLKLSEILSDLYEAERRTRQSGPATRLAARKEVYEIHGWWSGKKQGNPRKSLEARLEGAAYCLIALFTGMRIHEVLRIKYGLQNNWREEDVEVDGGIKKICFLLSETTKLEARPAAYKWQTIPIVKTALQALEKGFRRYFDAGNQWLFPGRGHGSLAKKQAAAKNAVGYNIKNLCKVHKIKHNGEIWHLASHQFRKKFARIMIRQGLGMKALQDQLKHYDIEMTKIYGDVNLYAELQAEKFKLSAELIEEFVGNQIPVIGGGSEELGALRREFLGLAKKDRTKFLQSLPSKALVEQTDDGLCFYRAQKALCGGDKANCRPGDCNNSWMPAAGKKRTLIWRKRENERMMTFFKGEPLKIEFLKTRNAEIEKLLGQLDKLEAKL